MSNFGQLYTRKANKRGRCEWCYQSIESGETYHNCRGMYDGDWQNWKMHIECYDSYELDACCDNEWEFTPGSGERPTIGSVPKK